MATRAEVYNALDTEREYQNRVWPTSAELSIGEFILMAEEYLAKARAEWIKEKRPEINALNMLRKVGGICVNCMEKHGAPVR